MVEPAVEAAFDAAARIVGFALLSGGVALTAAALYRWYGRSPIPEGVAVLLGVGSVALWLNTTATLAGAVGGNTALLEPSAALFTIGAFAGGGIGADLGRRLGDRIGCDAAAVTGGVTGQLDAEMTTLVRSGGRVLRVTLPDEIADLDGYDPVSDARKRELAGTSLLFPRRLTVAELRDRLAVRLQEDYGVGRVEVGLAADGTVEHLALGGRPAGIGRTLPPGTVAVAIRADPPFAASPGDAVEVWRPGDAPERVAVAELRAAVGDVVTLVVDEGAAERLDDGVDYRLVTLPRSADGDRELLSALRGARVEAGIVDVASDGGLAGRTVGELDVTVVAIETGDGLVGVPRPERTVAAGDAAYVIGAPDRVRALGARTVEAETTS